MLKHTLLIACVLVSVAAVRAEITANLFVHKVGPLQETGEQFVTYRVAALVSDTDDWTSAQMTATVTDATFYQDTDNDGNPPDPSGFSSYPDSEFTSYFTSAGEYPNQAYSGNVVGFSSGPVETATSLTADWFDLVDTGDGTFVIAQITVLPDSSSWSGQVDLTVYSVADPGGVADSFTISAADYGPPVTTTYVGPSPGSYNDPNNWDPSGAVPLNAGIDHYNVIIPDGVVLGYDVAGASEVDGLSLGGGSTLSFVLGESLLVRSTALISGVIDAFGSGAAFRAPSQFATFSGHPKVFVDSGAMVEIAASSYSYNPGINADQSILSATGTDSLLDLSSLNSISVPLCVGYGITRNYSIAATDGGVVDLSSVTSVSGASTSGDGYCFDWLRFLVATGGDIDLQSLTQVNGRTKFDVSVPAYSLPELENASNTYFDVPDGTLLSMPSLGSFSSGGTFNVASGGAIDAPQLTSFTSSTMAIADGGSVNSPLLTNFSGSTVNLNPSRIFTVAPLTNLDHARITLAEGATLTVAAPSYTCNPGINSDLTILSADGAGSYFDLSSVGSMSVPICVGYGVSRNYSVAATNGGVVDLSGLTSVTGASTSGDGYCFDWLRFFVATDGDITLPSLTQVNGRTWFDIDLPTYTLPALQESTGALLLDLDLGTLLSVPSLQRIGGSSNVVTVPVFAGIDAPSLTEINGTTVNLSVGGTIDSPNLTTFTSSTITLSPGRILNAPAFTNIDHSRIFVDGGETFTVSAPSYTYNLGINADQTLLSVDGAGSLLDMSSVGSLGVPLCVGYGVTRTYTIGASNNGVLDLSGLTLVSGASLSGSGYCGDWLAFSSEAGGRIVFGDVTVSGGRTQLVVNGTSSSLDFTGNLTLYTPSQLITTLSATVSLAGNYSFNHTNEAEINTGNGILHMVGVSTQSLEVGGENIGVPAGAVSGNFEIGQLIVGQTGQANIVHLGDQVDNGNRGGSGVEALYLQGFPGSANGLRILGGSTLVIENINVYTTESDTWVHINSLFGPGVNQIAYDQGFIALSIVASDCNNNGIEDRVDILLGNSDDCNGNGLPDECEIDLNSPAPGGPFFCTEDCDPDCNDNGIPDGCDISEGTSQDCNENGIPDDCDIADGTSADTNGNSVPDDCEDCNENGVPDYQDMGSCTGQPWCDDCNENGILDTCDISGGGSNDVNSNGVPDECDPDCNNNDIPDNQDIADCQGEPWCGDCNSNSKPDTCDIEDATSTDLNGNGIPDECEDCDTNGIPDGMDAANCQGEPWCSDCNSNQVLDTCDIAGGASNDVNNNGVPDECDPDCNNNDIPDDIDIADCQGELWCSDCNENQVPDECDITSGASVDSDGNGIPDDCEDCNNNGVLDYLDLADGTSEDCNGNRVPDECEVAFDVFSWVGPDGGSFTQPAHWNPVGVPGGQAELINASGADNTCVVDSAGETKICLLTIGSSGGVSQTLQIDDDRELTSTGGAVVNDGGQLRLTGGALRGGDVANGGRIFGSGTVAAPIDNAGTVESVGGGGSGMRVSGPSFTNQANGTLLAAFGTYLNVSAASVVQLGRIEAGTSASMLFGQPLVNQAGGEIRLLGGALGTETLTNAPGAEIYGFGTIEATLNNGGDATFIADSQVVGDLVNDGTITIESGLLTITGVLTGDGMLAGYSSPLPKQYGFDTSGGMDGVHVLGNYSAGTTASLVMSSDLLLVRLAGDFDVQISDNANYDMVEATLQLSGYGAPARDLEVMSTDEGPVVAGLDRTQTSHYPIGTLRIGPTNATVNLVDNHDNDGSGQADGEAIYVDELIIESGTTLYTNGYHIYYRTLKNNGSADDLSNLIPIGSPGCPADFDNDGDVDQDDSDLFEACASGPDIPLEPGCQGKDFDSDNDIDQDDFAIVQRCYSGLGVPADPSCAG